MVFMYPLPAQTIKIKLCELHCLPRVEGSGIDAIQILAATIKP